MPFDPPELQVASLQLLQGAVDAPYTQGHGSSSLSHLQHTAQQTAHITHGSLSLRLLLLLQQELFFHKSTSISKVQS